MENGSQDDDVLIVLRLLNNSTRGINSTLNNIQEEILGEILTELRSVKVRTGQIQKVHDILYDILSETRSIDYKVLKLSATNDMKK